MVKFSNRVDMFSRLHRIWTSWAARAKHSLCDTLMPPSLWSVHLRGDWTDSAFTANPSSGLTPAPIGAAVYFPSVLPFPIFSTAKSETLSPASAMPADGPFWQASYGLWPASIVLPGTGRSGSSYYFGKSWGPHVQSSTPFPDSSIAPVRTTATQSSAQDPPTSSVDVTSSSWSSPPPPSLPMSVSPLPNSGTFSSNVATHSSSEVDSSVNPMSAPQSVAGDSSSFSAVVGVAASSQSSTGVSGGTIYSKSVYTTAIPDSTFSTVMNPSSTYTPVSLTTSTSSGASSSSSKTPQIVGAVLGTLGALLLILVAFFYYRRRTSRRRLESRQDWWCEVHPEPSLPPQSGVSPSPAPVTISESVGSYGTGLHTTDNESGDRNRRTTISPRLLVTPPGSSGNLREMRGADSFADPVLDDAESSTIRAPELGLTVNPPSTLGDQTDAQSRSQVGEEGGRTRSRYSELYAITGLAL